MAIQVRIHNNINKITPKYLAKEVQPHLAKNGIILYTALTEYINKETISLTYDKLQLHFGITKDEWNKGRKDLENKGYLIEDKSNSTLQNKVYDFYTRRLRDMF